MSNQRQRIIRLEIETANIEEFEESRDRKFQVQTLNAFTKDSQTYYLGVDLERIKQELILAINNNQYSTELFYLIKIESGNSVDALIASAERKNLTIPSSLVEEYQVPLTD